VELGLVCLFREAGEPFRVVPKHQPQHKARHKPPSWPDYYPPKLCGVALAGQKASNEARTKRGVVMRSDYSSPDFDGSCTDLRARADRMCWHAWMLAHDEIAERLLALARELDRRADATERRSPVALATPA
jgi:hypothetical protein